MASNNSVIGLINLLPLLLSLPIIATGIWLMTQAEISCINLLNWPVIALGIGILTVAVFGIVGGFRGIQPLMVIYLVAMLVLMVLLGALVVLVFRVTSGGSAHQEPNRAYLEYRFDDDYSGWLRREVRSRAKWDRVRKCLSSTDACGKLNQTFHNAQDFFNATLSPVQSGCCKPPTECGYTYVSPTYWISPINMTADRDCLAWSNEQLCYECDSCKAGMLAVLRKEWRKAGFVLLATLFFLACVYVVVGFYVCRRSKTDELVQKYEQGKGSSSYT